MTLTIGELTSLRAKPAFTSASVSKAHGSTLGVLALALVDPFSAVVAVAAALEASDVAALVPPWEPLPQPVMITTVAATQARNRPRRTG